LDAVAARIDTLLAEWQSRTTAKQCLAQGHLVFQCNPDKSQCL
jgi:hypothetical protein